MAVKDILNREIAVGDYVVFTNNVYQVIGMGKPGSQGHGMVRMKLINPSPTTRPVTKFSREMAILPKGDVIFGLLKQTA